MRVEQEQSVGAYGKCSACLSLEMTLYLGGVKLLSADTRSTAAVSLRFRDAKQS